MNKMIDMEDAWERGMIYTQSKPVGGSKWWTSERKPEPE